MTDSLKELFRVNKEELSPKAFKEFEKVFAKIIATYDALNLEIIKKY